MPENKTKPTESSVEDFPVTTTPDRRRDDARRVVELMREVTGEQPVMWGSAIIGFGKHHYRYASGREGDVCRVGVSPRKAATMLYLTCDLDRHQSVLDRLGPHERGAGCLYIKRLDAVDESVLRELIKTAWAQR